MNKTNILLAIHNSNLIEDIDDPNEDAQSCEAWAYIVDKSNLTFKHVMHLHRLITINQLPASESGAVRRIPVWIGDTVCPEPFLAGQMLSNWILTLRDSWQTLDPKRMHIRFEKIHPFVDGNGRTGRMLMWWHERKLGREPTLIEFSKRQEYYKWFR